MKNKLCFQIRNECLSNSQKSAIERQHPEIIVFRCKGAHLRPLATWVARTRQSKNLLWHGRASTSSNQFSTNERNSVMVARVIEGRHETLFSVLVWFLLPTGIFQHLNGSVLCFAHRKPPNCKKPHAWHPENCVMYSLRQHRWKFFPSKC